MDIKDIVIIIHHTLLSMANYLWAVTRCNSFMPQQVVVKCVHAARDNSLKLFPKLQQDLHNIKSYIQLFISCSIMILISTLLWDCKCGLGDYIENFMMTAHISFILHEKPLRKLRCRVQLVIPLQWVYSFWAGVCNTPQEASWTFYICI